MNIITTSEVQKKLEAGEPLHLIDVREPEEVADGHIAGITHITLGDLEARLDELNKETPYVIICRSGNRSGKATDLLTANGYNATNMVGGMLDWAGDVTK